MDEFFSDSRTGQLLPAHPRYRDPTWYEELAASNERAAADQSKFVAASLQRSAARFRHVARNLRAGLPHRHGLD
ncbi:MAG: hypothetical protein IRZ21_03135 [Thermoleophilaceae bacterium]|nr:hypothetical protein [Thermoleophilaceae bacterium]